MESENTLIGSKITVVGQSSSDGSGVGGSARLKNMTNIFLNLGMDVDIISYSFFSNKFEIEKKTEGQLKITVLHVPDRMPKILKSLLIFPVFYYAFKSSKNSDLIFSDFITEIAYLPSIILGKLFRKPIILDLIDINFFKITEFIKKHFIKKADMVFAISYFLFNQASNHYNCKNVVYMPNFIDTNLFKFDKNIREIKREQLGLKTKDIVIGYTGSFAEYEGLGVLINAFKILKKKYPQTKLAIMGKAYFSGDENIEKILKNLDLENEVIFIPPQKYETVPQFLSAFDILACSKIDCEINRVANPVKVTEYISMGLPTVCSAVGGIIDTIEDNLNGFLVVPGDVNSLVEQIEWIILNPEKSDEIGGNGRKKALKEYSYNAMNENVKEALINLIKN